MTSGRYGCARSLYCPFHPSTMLVPSGAQSACTYIWIPLPRSPAACVTAGLSGLQPFGAVFRLLLLHLSYSYIFQPPCHRNPAIPSSGISFAHCSTPSILLAFLAFDNHLVVWNLYIWRLLFSSLSNLSACAIELSNVTPFAGVSTTYTRSTRVLLMDSVATRFRRRQSSWVMLAAVMAATDQRPPTVPEFFQILAMKVVPTRHSDKPRHKPAYSTEHTAEYFERARYLAWTNSLLPEFRQDAV
jgi:hypothetical protein